MITNEERQKQKRLKEDNARHLGVIFYSMKPADNAVSSYADWSDMVWAVFNALQDSDSMAHVAARFLDTAMCGYSEQDMKETCNNG